MSAFKSENAYWDFAQTVLNERRFIFDGKAGRFIAAARAASKSRAYCLPSGSPLYRAQIGTDIVSPEESGRNVEEEHPFQKVRMIPDPRSIKRGDRANPAGFAYLYLANNAETALAEMRPWVGESLSLATFRTEQKLKLVICRAGQKSLLKDIETRTAKLDRHVWGDISQAFARPVNQEDQQVAYLPTQILAEAFKAEGFDGIGYSSGLARGTNIVLFDRQAAVPVELFAYTLKKVRYDFETVPNYCICRRTNGNVEYLTEIHTESP